MFLSSFKISFKIESKINQFLSSTLERKYEGIKPRLMRVLRREIQNKSLSLPLEI